MARPRPRGGRVRRKSACEIAGAPEEARALGLQTGAVEGLGEAVATPVLGKFLSGGAKIAFGKMPLQAALESIQNPKFLKEFGKQMLTTGAVETGTEVGQSYAEAAIEKNAGIATEDP